MDAIIALGLLAAAQGGLATAHHGADETREVAFEEMQNGENRAAIAKLEAALANNPDDPAILINLGSAYALSGNLERAEDYYRAAMRSDIRYNVELADGSWADTRILARRALASLDGQAVAMK